MVAATRPSCERFAVLIDWAEVEDVGRPGAMAAAPVALTPPAMTVIALAFAPEPAAVLEELFELPLPATTVTAPPAAEAVELELDAPWITDTVTAPPAAEVVVAATRPS